MFGEIICEYLDRVRAGETVDREAFLARFPEHAEALRAFFEDFDLVNSLFGWPQATLKENGGDEPSAGNAESKARDPEAKDERTHENPLAAFEIVEELHRGAQGVVYRAVQRSTDRVVALKVLHGRAASSFKHEARLVAGLRHPNVVTVYQAGLTEGRPYCAMELVEGVPLDTYLSEHALDTRAKLHLFVRICAGVMHAHQYSVIHRDLKPSNILVEPNGEPRVLDFGLAKYVGIDQAGAPAPPEFEGAFVGTFAYASPEQIAGRYDEIGTCTDVYALGVILYEMLTGHRPYSVPENRLAALEMIAHTEPPCPSTMCRGLSDDLDCIVRKAIAKDPAARYRSVESLAREIAEYLTRRPIEQKRSRRGYVLQRFVSRHRRTLAAATAAACVLGAVGVKMLLLMVEKQATAMALAEEQAALAAEKAAAEATALARFKAARQTNLEMLEGFQANFALANRVAEIAPLSPDQTEAHLARYQSPRIEADGVFVPLVGAMPADLIAAIRSAEGPKFDEAARWLDELADQLDSLAARLESRAFRFPVSAGSIETQGSGLGWDYVAVHEAARTCEALVGRAYQRRAANDHRGAIADIRAATLLASDIGDGVLRQHAMYCYHCQDQILGFLQVALTEAIENHEAAELYAEQALAHPPAPRAAASLMPTRLGLVELLHLAMVAESNDADERIDLVRLDGFLGGFLKAEGALTEENIGRLADSNPVDFILLTDRYVGCADAWDTLTAYEIREQVKALKENLLRERETNPMLWFFSLPGERFLARLRTCSQRQALRLAALVTRYRTEHDEWPGELTDALPPDAAEETIDPRTGQAFVYDVTAGLPRIRSAFTDDMRGKVGPNTLAWAAEEDDLVTYFPARARRP